MFLDERLGRVKPQIKHLSPKAAGRAVRLFVAGQQ